MLVLRAVERDKTDPLGAFALAAEEDAESQPLSSNMWRTLGSLIGDRHADFAKELLGDLDRAIKRDLLRSTAGYLASRTPREIADWARGIGGERGEQVQEAVLSAWRRQDEAAAAEWEAESLKGGAGG